MSINAGQAPRTLTNASRKEAAESLREVVATVGKTGRPGEQVRCVVSIQMLTEGWDANNVTHILGLRAFGSQLLCEQVVGRGLRRIDYTVGPETGLLTEEYVDVYGIQGWQDDRDLAKHQAAKRWCSAVNNWGELGRWAFHVCKDPQMLGKELAWLRVSAGNERHPRYVTPVRCGRRLQVENRTGTSEHSVTF
ncbi:MAG: hypothetical protein QMD32_02980 [Smithellaceae bacterium]|nr:hypothetical protein [Smithellaceae bacterium]